MDKNNLMKNNIFIKKVFVSIFIFLFILNINLSNNNVFAQNTSPEEALLEIENTFSGGLISDCGRTDPDKMDSSKACSPKDAFSLGTKLLQISIYIIVIALVLTIVISGVMYTYNSNNPAFLSKIKKYIKNSATALGIILLVTAVFALLDAIGFNPDLSNFLRQLFASTDFSIINHAFAQNIPDLSTGSNKYINFFDWDNIFVFAGLVIKFFINYFAAPALVIAVVIAGFMFVKAQGNAAELDKAKKFSKGVVIGIVAAASAQLIVGILLNTVKDISSEAGVNTIRTETSTSTTK
jgi:hypothetical protein